MILKSAVAFVFLTLSSFAGWAAEESVDFEQETVKAPHPTGNSKFSIMGRVDLTAENRSFKAESQTKDADLDNYHFFIFLKVQASPKTDFMGEIAKQSFFSVDYRPSETTTLSFGKLIVPFGDTRYFHHFYGGIQGYGGKGVMFRNIWAEPGASVQWHLGSLNLDTYVVNTIASTSATTEPAFQTAGESTRQAGGLRATFPLFEKVTFVASAYQGEWWPRRPVALLGVDVYSEYGVFGQGFGKHFRWSYGNAAASVQKNPNSGGDYQKKGDYLQISMNFLGPGETRLRYGTYIDDTRVVTKSDTRSVCVGYQLPIDVMKLLAEYQWNLEAVSETDNDVARMMLSLDF